MEVFERRSKVIAKLVNNVDFVQNDDRLHPIHLAGDEQTVNKRELNLRKRECHDNESVVDIRGYYVRLTAEIHRLADDVISSWKYPGDCSRRSLAGRNAPVRKQVPVRMELHPVAHGHRICRRTTAQPHFSAQHRREQPPRGKLSQKIVTASMFDDRCCSFHNAFRLLQIHFCHRRCKDTKSLSVRERNDKPEHQILRNCVFNPKQNTGF